MRWIFIAASKIAGTSRIYGFQWGAAEAWGLVRKLHKSGVWGSNLSELRLHFLQNFFFTPDRLPTAYLMS